MRKVQAPAPVGGGARRDGGAHGPAHRALAQEISKATTLQAQLDARIESVEQQIASDTQSTANRLINAGELTALPAALASLHAELTATRHTRDEVARRIQTPSMTPCRIRSVWRATAISEHRPSSAEIELQEQLPAFIGVIARAAVARHRAGFSREQGRYEIEIPVETLEVANTVLDADLSAR
jgi:hypothetical protein